MTEDKTLPFIRHDSYGELGLHINRTQWIRLVLLGIVFVPLKSAAVLLLLLSYYFLIKLSELLPTRWRSDFAAFTGKIHCRACLFCLGFIRVRWVSVDPNPQKVSSPSPLIGIVSNHCSWCDILLHMSRYFPSFVARHSTKDLPIIGPIRKVQLMKRKV